MNLLHLTGAVYNKDSIEKVNFMKRAGCMEDNCYLEAFYFEHTNGPIKLKVNYDTRPTVLHEYIDVKPVSNFCKVNKKDLYEAIERELEYYYHFDYKNFNDLVQNKLFVVEEFRNVYSIRTNIQLFNEVQITTKSGEKSTFITRKDYEKIKKEFSELKISE